MNRVANKADERLALVAQRTGLAIQQLKDNGINFTNELFWASVDDAGRVKFGDWHPFETPEYDVVQRIWDDPWLECNAKLAAVGYKIVFGASENDCLWREFEWLFESRCREILVRAAKLTERSRHQEQKKVASDRAGEARKNKADKRKEEINEAVLAIFDLAIDSQRKAKHGIGLTRSRLTVQLLNLDESATALPDLARAGSKKETRKDRIRKAIRRLDLRSDPRLR